MQLILPSVIKVVARAGKGLITLKNELIIGLLYFVVLAPAAVVRKILLPGKRTLRARQSRWVDILTEGDLES